MMNHGQAPCSKTPSLLPPSEAQGRHEHTGLGDLGPTRRGVHIQRNTLGCGEPLVFLSPNHFPLQLPATHSTPGSPHSFLPASSPLPEPSQGKHVSTPCWETELWSPSGVANSHKKHLVWIHVWQTRGTSGYAGKETSILPFLFIVFCLQNAIHNCLIVIFMDQSLPAPDFLTLGLSTLRLQNNEDWCPPPRTSKLRRQVLWVPICLWGRLSCSSGFIYGHRKRASLPLGGPALPNWVFISFPHSIPSCSPFAVVSSAWLILSWPFRLTEGLSCKCLYCGCQHQFFVKGQLVNILGFVNQETKIKEIM